MANQCPKCRMAVQDNAKFCKYCGASIVPAQESLRPAVSPASQPPGIVSGTPYAGPPIFYKNPGVATLLSFFWMGAGQIYNGQIGKGIAFIIAYLFSLLLMFVLIGFITTPILWIIGMVDAHGSAQTINWQLSKKDDGRRPYNTL